MWAPAEAGGYPFTGMGRDFNPAEALRPVHVMLPAALSDATRIRL